jgi:hypothetical protein
MCPLRQPGSRHFQIPTLGQHVSHLGQGNPVRIAYSPGWLDAGIHHRPKGPALTLSLSSAYKRGQWLEISAPLDVSYPMPRWARPPTHCRLVDDWLGHLPIPLAGLILVPPRSFCPKFRVHWARAPASTAPSTADLCSTLVSSCYCTSDRQWGMA